MSRYEVYTLRRASSRTVYAIYDNLRSEPVCKNGTQTPVTTTDRDVARRWRGELETADAFTPPDPFSRKV